MSWYNETLRKVHILYVSPQWVAARGERFDAQEYVRRLKDAGITVIQVYAKDHHGVCYYPCSLGLPYPRDIMRELHEACREAGLRIMAYFSVCFDNYALGLFPEWRIATASGEAPRSGAFFTACPNSGYREYALQQLRELARHSPWDGIWLDIIPLAWGTTPLWLLHNQYFPCYCLGCQRVFERRFGRRLPLTPSADDLAESFTFMTEATESFLQEMYDTIRQVLPEAIITYNGAGAPGDPIDSADLVSIEGHAPNYARQSLLARWGRVRSKPFEIMTAGAVTGWNGWDLKPAATLELEMAIAAVQGGSMTVGLAPYPSGALEPGWFETYTSAYRAIEHLEPLVRATTGVYDVGLVVATKPRTAPTTWSPMFQTAEAMHELLMQEHFLHGLVPEIAALEGYEVLILANHLSLSEAEAQLVRKYVAQGGHLLITGETGLVDEAGQRRQDFPLADVMGLHFEGKAQLRRTYVRVTDAQLRSDIPDMPLALDQSPIVVRLDGGEVLATFSPGEAELTDATTVLWGYPPPLMEETLPLAVSHRFGAGRCLYLATDVITHGFASIWLRMLGRNAVRVLVPEPRIVLDAPPTVEVVLNHAPGRHVLHLLNHEAGAADTTPQSFAVQGIRVHLHRRLGTFARARAAFSGEPVQLQHEEDGVVLQMPPLQTQLALILE
jgi:hypothetical protein